MATEFLNRQIRILHLEDNEVDRMFVKETLKSEGMAVAITAVSSQPQFDQALRAGDFDLIISDYTLPSYDGLRAVALAREVRPDIPFIFFSGTIGEEVAVESLKNGAADYVLKQRPHRLVASVRQAIRSAEERARRKRAEESLRQLEERFALVARTSDDVIWDWDVSSNSVWYSPNIESVFGYPLQQIKPGIEGWHELIHAEDRDRYVEEFRASSSSRMWWSEHRVRRADGSYAYVFDRVSFIQDSEGKLVRVVGVAIDVSERKGAEMKIREQAELLDKARDAILLCNMDLEIQYWNEGAQRIYGWHADEVRGKTISAVLLRGNPPPQMQEIFENIDTRGEWAGELKEFTRDGKTLITQVHITLIRDHANAPKALLMINTDVTERKKLEEQFLRAQRLESLGVLVSGIAHDLNNALAPVLMGINLLSSQSSNKDSKSILNMMETSARRGADMVRQVLTFARGESTGKTSLQLEQLAKELCKVVSEVFPRNIHCRVNVEARPWPVSGVATQLHQVLMNLCVNARDAMPEGGSLTINVRNVELDEAAAAQIPDARAGKFVCLSVKDTGTGIDPDQLKQIFEPFFTTKPAGKGTGLGLSTSRNIVHAHEGFMFVSSEPGKGSEFLVYLPATSTPVEKPASETGPAATKGHGKTILVVDDEAATVAIMRTTLEEFGFRVITAGNGPEAITLFGREPLSIDYILTDLMMPFMEGRDVVRALRELAPGTPIIAMSGLDRERCDVDQSSVAAFLSKPFTVEQLLSVVTRIEPQAISNQVAPA